MFYNYSNFSKETQNRFWIHEFLQETHPEKYRNQCLQYIVTVTTDSSIIFLEIIE